MVKCRTLNAKNLVQPLCQVVSLSKAYLSRAMRKPDFCLCENKGADQLRGNRDADQRLCFRFSDSTFPFLVKFEI